MLIRDIATIFKNKENTETKKLTNYTQANKKTDAMQLLFSNKLLLYLISTNIYRIIKSVIDAVNTKQKVSCNQLIYRSPRFRVVVLLAPEESLLKFMIVRYIERLRRQLVNYHLTSSLSEGSPNTYLYMLDIMRIRMQNFDVKSVN